MERPIQEVVLPVSGAKAEIYTYYLRGERKEIEAIMFESAQFEQDESGTPKLKKVDASYRTKMEDKAVLIAIKSLTDKLGANMDIKIETLDSLPSEDFELLQASLPGNQSKKK